MYSYLIGAMVFLSLAAAPALFAAPEVPMPKSQGDEVALSVRVYPGGHWRGRHHYHYRYHRPHYYYGPRYHYYHTPYQQPYNYQYYYWYR